MAKRERPLPKHSHTSSLVNVCRRGDIPLGVFVNYFVNQLNLDHVEDEVRSLPEEYRQKVKDYIQSLPITDPEWQGMIGITGYVPNESKEQWQERFEGIQKKNLLSEKALYDIFGNPGRPMSIDVTWLTSTVVYLAQSIYNDRAFDRMPILADALEDAGCTNASILEHCRSAGQHVRGCWVVDLVLGKE